MSRLTIEIDADQHRQIKTLATFEGKTIKEFILSRTLPPKDTTEELLGSGKNAQRLKDALATPDSQNRVFETVEDLKDALGV